MVQWAFISLRKGNKKRTGACFLDFGFFFLFFLSFFFSLPPVPILGIEIYSGPLILWRLSV